MTEIQDILNQTTLSIEGVKAAHTSLSSSVPCPKALSFCHDLSKSILNAKQAQNFPSLQALGFWLRPANLTKIIEENLYTAPHTRSMPRGIVFQIPPRNVDVLFGYSLVLSLLCGNTTIVRLWDNRTEEQNELIKIIRTLTKETHQDIRQRLLLLSYGRKDEVTTALSALCQTRMVWGGDATVKHIRSMPLPPLANEVSFADRFSAALIKANSFLQATEEEQTKLLHSFARDLMSFDQKACTSPRLLYWHGTKEDTAKAAKAFYPALCDVLSDQFGLPDAGATVERNNNAFLAFHDLDVTEEHYKKETLRVFHLHSTEGLERFKDIPFGHGMLLDLTIQSLNDLPPLAHPKDQTIGHWGYDLSEIKSLVQNHKGKGFDRYIPIGQTLNFDPVWDGYNLFEIMTKRIRVQL